jgi:hypothetical protein
MANVYIIVYNHPSLEDLKKTTIENDKTNVFLKEYNNWHYDVGDDPAFFCANRYKSNVTWGICRPDVRNNIKANDVVVFFCFNCEQGKYYFVGFSTVKQKIKQTDIWSNDVFSIYQKYYNLLIRKMYKKWGHFEPLFKKKGQHKNWYSRLGALHPKDSFMVKDDSFLTEFIINDNYVIFYSEDKYQRILKHPIHVANWEKGRKKEVWENETNCDAIYNFIFANTSRKSIRIHERNSAHRHIKIIMTTDKLENWRDDFIELLNKIED